MKQSKNTIFTLFLFMSLAFGAKAQTVDLVANVNVTPPLNNGQTFQYELSSTGDAYTALRIKLVYDPSVIQLNSLNPQFSFDFTPVNDTSTPGLIRYEAASFMPGGVTTDADLFTITFEVLDNSQAISIAHNYDAADGTVVVNSGGNDILGTANNILLETLGTSAWNLEQDISIYPNPAHDHVIIKTGTAFPIQEVSLLSLSGQVVVKQDFNSTNRPLDHTIKIDTARLPHALYFLSIRTTDGQHLVHKLLVAH